MNLSQPRVINHVGYFYICYYLPGNKNAVKDPVGISLDIDPPQKDEKGKIDPNWWQASSHKKQIKVALNAAIIRKATFENSGTLTPLRKRSSQMSLERLSELYNAEMKIARAKQSKATLEKRKYAILKVREFDRYAAPH